MTNQKLQQLRRRALQIAARGGVAMTAITAVTTVTAMTALGPTSAWAADPAKILMKDFMFTPMSMTVKAGATVNWINMDDEPHTVVSDTGLFRSSGLDTNEVFSYKFDKPGTYHVVCSIHPRMVATIVVE